MISATSSALSALEVFSTRLHSHASNIANAQSEGYTATRVTLAAGEQGGVIAEIDRPAAAGPLPQGDDAGGVEPVEFSNVELGRDIPEMILNSRYYQANLKTIQQENDMLDSLLDLKI